MKMAHRSGIFYILVYILASPSGIQSQFRDIFLQVDTPPLNPTVDGFPTLYLSDKLILNVILQLGNAGERLRVQLAIPDEFDTISYKNHSITYGSNILDANETVGITESYFSVTFGQLEVINATIGNDSQENVVEISYPVHLRKFKRIGNLFNVTLVVEYGSGYQNVFTTSRALRYGGPDVDIEGVTTIQGGSFIFDRETRTSVSLKIPSGPWNMSSIQLVLEFKSEDVNFIALDVLQCLASADTPNVTFTRPDSRNVTNFSNSSSAVGYVTYYNVTGTPGNARRKRAVSSGGQAKATLVWSLFDIVNIGDKLETLNFTIRSIIGKTGDLVNGATMTSVFTMHVNQVEVLLESNTLVVWEPDLQITKTVTMLNEKVEIDQDYSLNYLQYTTILNHTAQHNAASAYSIIFRDQVQGLILEYFKSLVPVYGTEGLTVSSQELVYEADELPVGSTLTFSYKAYFDEDTVSNNIDSALMHTSSATWRSMPAAEITAKHTGRSYSPDSQPETCVTPVGATQENIIYNHGLSAAFFFVALAIGFIVVAIICLICIKCYRKGPYATVQPEGKYDRESQGRGLVLTPRGGAKSGLTTLKEFSMIAIDDSIILVLALRDKTRKRLEFDNLDIWWTITVDIQLEQQRLDAMVESSINLLNKWTIEGAVPRKVCDRANRNLEHGVKDLNKSVEDEYKTKCRGLIKELSSQNKTKLAELQKKHRLEYDSTLTQTEDMSKEEKDQMMSLLRQQHEAERRDVMFLLKLQQDEQQEKVRKELAIRKRLAVKSLQQSHLDDVILQSKLDEDVASKILREQRSNMASLETAVDEELSRQRLLTEEKLARRRALAQSSESLADHHKKLLNTAVTQTMETLCELAEDDKLTDEQLEQYTTRLRQEFLTVKAGYDKEMSSQEEALHKRLSDLKKKKLEEKDREHKQHLEQFEKEQKAKLENNSIDPSQYTQTKLSLLASHRTEIHDLELSLDEDAAKQLEELYKELANTTKQKLGRSKEGFFKQLTNHGMTDKMKREILEQHERDMERLIEEHEEERLKQERLLKKRLAKHRQEWIKRKQEEKESQQLIRDHEEKVLGRVLAAQLAISEEDRQRILEEHEKQQAALESSLALQKLRQRCLLEEKVAQRRARRMAKLQQRHEQEKLQEARKRQLAESDEDESETEEDLIKKQAQEKVALLTRDDTEDLDDELEDVREEMMKAKAHALKEQEEHLGALVAKLQLERSREIATIEEQQQALWQLKMNMLDNMTETGVIGNTDCKKVIEMHHKEAKSLDKKINSQREKQEKEFKRRLRAKLAEREQTFLDKQEEELKALAEKEKNKTSARLRLVAFRHRHLMEMEEFRHNLEIEVNQALEDLRRTFEVERLKQLQEQELQFISGLVKHGKFSMSELRSVLHLLFPAKTRDELEPLLLRMYNKEEGEGLEELGEEGDKVANGNLKRVTSKHEDTSSLEEKVRLAILGHTDSSAVSTPSKERKRPNKLLKKLKKNKTKKLRPISAGSPREDYDDQLHKQSTYMYGDALPEIDTTRPDPVGRTATPKHEPEIDRTEKMESDSEDEEESRHLRRQKESGKHFGKTEYSY